MRHPDSLSRSSRLVLPLALALGALIYTPAFAGQEDHRHKKQRNHAHERVREHHGPKRHVRHTRARHSGFVIPEAMHRKQHKTYRAYYHGRVPYRPHRHDHAVYYFPVSYRDGYALKPHFYCSGRLYRARVSYRGPRVSLNLRF